MSEQLSLFSLKMSRFGIMNMLKDYAILVFNIKY